MEDLEGLVTEDMKKMWELKDSFNAEILLSVLEMDLNEGNMAAATEYIDTSYKLKDMNYLLVRQFDRLIDYAEGSWPESVERGERLWLAELLQTLGNISSLLDGYESIVNFLSDTEIGKKVYNADRFEEKLETAYLDRYDDIIELAAEIDRLDPLPEFVEQGEPPGEETNFTLLKDDLKESLAGAAFRMELLRFGIPSDFYDELLKAHGKISYNRLMYFIRESYRSIESRLKTIHPGEIWSGLEKGRAPIRGYLINNPDEVIPDPEELKRIRETAYALDLYDKEFPNAIKLFATVAKSYGRKTLDVIGNMLRLEQSEEVFEMVGGAVVASKEKGEFIFEMLCKNPSFVRAYHFLRKEEIEEEKVVDILTDFGDYMFNGKDMASVIAEAGMADDTEAVNFIAVNALYLCCGEGSKELIDLVSGEKKDLSVLEKYVGFVANDEVFKQAATIIYVKQKGADKLKGFIEKVETYSEGTIGHLVDEFDEDVLIEKIESSFDGTEEEYTNQLETMNNYDLVKNYKFVHQLINASEESLDAIDEAISVVRGTPYEKPLLGHAEFRRRFIEQVIADPEEGERITADLPKANPYDILKERLKTDEERTVEYGRILFFVKSISEKTVSEIEEEVGVGARVISVDAAHSTFETIGENDLIIYNTSRTSHEAYGIVKKLASDREAEFRHTTTNSKDVLLDIIYNKSE